MRSRCTEIWFIYSVATLLVLPFSVSSAPSENRNNHAEGEKENVFMQSSPTNSDHNEGDKIWYPTIDLSKDSDNEDYETDNFAKEQPLAEPPVKAKLTKITIMESKKSSPGRESRGKSDFKTFCEDGSKGNCSSSKSKPKKQIMVSQKGIGQSCEQIIGEMRNITGNKNQIETDEVTKLRELIESLSNVMKCDATNSKSSSLSLAKDASKDMKPPGPIAEIEQKQITETKIIKANDHQEKQEITNVVDTIMENTETPLKTTKIPVTRPPPPPPPPPHIQENNVKKEVDYLSLPSDVNYNGGINKHMDDLKRMYPGGHWPDQDGDSEEVSSETKEQESGGRSRTIEYNDMYTDDADEDEKDDERDSQDIANFDYDLTPEYLEMIIQNERVSSPKKSNNDMHSFHHVQEHKLPIRK